MENCSDRTKKIFENLEKRKSANINLENNESQSPNISQNVIVLNIPEVTDNLDLSNALHEISSSNDIDMNLNLNFTDIDRILETSENKVTATGNK